VGKCLICQREAEYNELCNLHKKAYENIHTQYLDWKKAMNLSWEEYLNRLTENPYTGTWAKMLAKKLLESKG